MEKIEIFFKNSDLSKSSIKIYTLNILKIMNDYKLKYSDNMFNNFNVLTKIINDTEIKDNTKKNKLMSILSFLNASKQPEEVINKYREEADKINIRIKEVNKKMEKSEKENKNWLEINELKEKINKLKKVIEEDKKINLISTDYNYLFSYMKYIILLIHSNTPMRNDLSDAEIYNITKFNKKIDNTINYIFISKNKGYILLNNYKTFKNYGTQQINIDNDILKEIIKYYNVIQLYKKSNDINNNWFLIKRNGDKLNRNDYTKFFNKIFIDDDKKISTTMMRKIIISDTYNADKIDELSKKCQHSPAVALSYYAKKK